MKRTLVELEFTRNVQLALNLIANIIAFGVSAGVGFFLSPYIVKHLGAEANGFVTLANNFVSYATLIKTALNTLASRFIIVSYHRGEIEKANRYYSSAFYGDLIIAVAASVIGIGIVYYLDSLINIPSELVFDVKLLFLLIFLNFSFNTVTTVFSSAPYIKNKVYLQSLRDIQCNVSRAIVLIILFSFFSPKVYYLGIATLIPGLILIGYNIYYKMKLVPELRISRYGFSWLTIKELISQGVWNSITSLGSMLLTSFDLLIANLFIGAAEMGVLSVAKSMPGLISGIGSTLAGVFFSEMTINYAKNDIKGLTKTINESCMIIGAIVTIPLAYLIVFGREFYLLWQPTMDPDRLQILSILTCASFILCAGCNSINTIFTITLHLKQNAFSVLISGGISTIITLILVNTTNLGIYAVAAVSTVVDSIRNIIYIVPTAATYVGLKKIAFYPVILKSILSTIVLCITGFLIKTIVVCDSWGILIVYAILFAVVGLGINFIIVLNRDTRQRLIAVVKAKIL